MGRMIANIGIYDYDRNKICDLYDSQVNMKGRTYNNEFTKNYNGVNSLSFTMPYRIDGEENFRWQYMKSDYLVRLYYNGKVEWFVASKPEKSKDKSGVIGNVKCNGLPSLLKTKNIYSEFNDENGIGTISELMTKVLAGSGWRLGHCDTLYEKDGITEKIRSLKSGGKKGCLDNINTLCNLFRCRPEYNTDELTVNIYAYNNRDQMFEGEVGRNLNALSVKENADNIATRLYVEGEYAEDGYIGIDDVNPTGLTYLMNFDYYREIGVFKNKHEVALQNYLTDIQNVNSRIKQNALLINEVSDSLNSLIGQCDVVLYYTSIGFSNPARIYGDPAESKRALSVDDKVIVLNTDKTFRYETITSSAQALIQPGDYGIAKFVTSAAGSIGAMEVQVEAKQKQINNLQRKIDSTTKDDKKTEYGLEIQELQAQIQEIYTQQQTGLYAQMYSVMNTNGLIKILDDYFATYNVLRLEQDNIEATFIVAMGNMLRDGYWQNNNYAHGQEQALYEDALEMSAQLAKPEIEYSIDYIRSAPVCRNLYYAYYSSTDPSLDNSLTVMPGEYWVRKIKDPTPWISVRLQTWQEIAQSVWNDLKGIIKLYKRTENNTWTEVSSMTQEEPNLTQYGDIPIEDVHMNAIMRINDDEMNVHENLFVQRIVIGIDQEDKGTLDVSNEDLTINSNDLGSLLSRMSQLADLIDQKNALYERAKAISSNKTIYTDRLNGQIDVLKTQMLSTVSNWYTDDQGNIMFLSADGGSAMMLCGAGFMIANSKDEDGEWNWRTFGTGA